MSDESGSDHTLIRQSGAGKPVAAPSAFTPPRQIKHFILEKLLGRGGMAAVFLAKDTAHDRLVALKLMDPGLSTDPTFVERFSQEAKNNAALSHPNVVEVYDHGEENGWYFLATEFVDGGTVADLLEKMRELPPVLAGELVAQLLSGLDHAHQKGVVHRDLKPENLLMSAGGILKIADFGIAKAAENNRLTKTGMLVGTAGYMSPEQAKGLHVDRRSDLFTVGIILYEMLSGLNPFQSDNPATSITKILQQAMAPIFEVKPTAPAELEGVLDKLLAFDAGSRFQSATEALTALLPFVENRRRTQPTLVAECLKKPDDMKELLDSQAALALVNEVRGLVDGNQLEMNRAALKLHFALQLDSGHREAQTLLDYLMQKMPVQFGQSQNPKIAELLKQLELTPNAPAVLTQLGNLYRLEGNLFRAAVFLKRYLRLKPNDSYAANQLFQIIGERPRTGQVAAPKPGSTQDLLQGVRTGGFKARPPTASAQQAGGATQSNSTVPALQIDEVVAVNPLKAQLIKLGLIAAVLLLVFLGIRKVFRFVDTATTETAQKSDAIRQNIGPANAAPNEPVYDVSSELQKRDGANSKAAADLLNAAVAKETEQDVAGALAAYDQLLRDFPKREQAPKALFRKAKLLLREKRNGEAHEAFDQFLGKYPGAQESAEALFSRGQAAANNLKNDDALKDFDAFIANHASNPLIDEAYVWRGEVRARGTDAAGARADFEQIIGRISAGPVRERAQQGLDALPKP